MAQEFHGTSISFSDLDVGTQALVEEALCASGSAYAPYSGFAVGAAILTATGTVYRGSNFENASLGLSICAEVSALSAFHMAAVGDSAIVRIAVIGHRYISPREVDTVVTPCGRCRQLLLEESQISQRDIEVLSCNGSLTHIMRLPISQLLPHGFGPQTFMGQQFVHGYDVQPLRRSLELLLGNIRISDRNSR